MEDNNKVFVFDFDCTLTARHLFHFLHNENIFKTLYNKEYTDEFYKIIKKYFDGIDVEKSVMDDVKVKFIDLIFGSEKRLESIKNMFTHIGRDNVYISSRGYRTEINQVLKFVGLDEYINHYNIYGNEKFKSTLLCELSEINKSVFYSDDDLTEHNNFVFVKNMEMKTDDKILQKYEHEGKTYIFYNFAKKTSEEGGLTISAMNLIPYLV
jgi:hypothetical protein